MKFKDLDGFGSLGKVAYDFDLATCSDDDIMRLGWEVYNELVVLVPAEFASVTPERYHCNNTLGRRCYKSCSATPHGTC